MVRLPVVQLQGELQLEVMKTLWRLDAQVGVEDVRSKLPADKQGAYTTIQTILNRLAERGLVKRKRHGKNVFYRAAVSEADYYSRSLKEALAPASDHARRAALAQLVGDLNPGELTEIEELARDVSARRDR
ncbi:MAG: BlaI/MecI/CopY family transcriptional regulator [Solirubrobacterales bacterium]|nr:BlaI/MecI/CopY family transcriptional regulator [Solirubrobacterales bacterium]